MKSVIGHLRRVALASGCEALSDAQLLEAFLSQREGAAFAALLRRHGPMVFGVCRRVLRNDQDAEDAFQATFLVLVRKAGSLQSRELLANWLYGVAYRTAIKARSMNAKRQAKERQVGTMPRTEPSADGQEELLVQLDYELNRLPEKYRVPVVLCELEGRSRKEAARLLKLPEGTLSWRLAQAKKLLAGRLSRFGAVAVVGLLAEAVASARPSPLLLKSTAKAVLKAGSVPAEVLTLTQGVLKAMLLTKLKVTLCAATLMLLAGIGATSLTYRAAAQQFNPGPSSGTAYASRTQSDELEALRLEIEALRKSLQATRERVKTLEGEVVALKGQRGTTGSMMPSGGSRGPMGAMSSGSSAAPGENQPASSGSGAMRERATSSGGGTSAATGTGKPITTGNVAPIREAADQRHQGNQQRNASGTQPGGPALDQQQPKAGNNRPSAPDPLAEAESALRKLRRDPNDMEAAEALEKALHKLKMKREIDRTYGR